MKLPQVKWTQRNCIMCALVIIAILLSMYLFRHYTVIEGFDFSTSAITSSTSSLTSSLPSMSSSDWGPIGPLPADNVVLPDTITKLKQIYTDNKMQPFMFRPDDASKYVTEAETQDFITNLKWTWSDKLLTCIKEGGKQNLIDAASKAGQPAPTDEAIAKMNTDVDNIPKSIPMRAYLPLFLMMGSATAPCIKDLKETIFYNQLHPRPAPGQSEREMIEKAYKVDDNKYLACGGGQPIIASWNSTTSKADSTPTTYSEFPTLVKGFEFITPVDDFAICDPQKVQKSAYSLDGGVSPFYSAFWGVPASSSSTFSSSTNSTSAPVSSSSSSDDPTAVLKDMKAKLNSMTLN